MGDELNGIVISHKPITESNLKRLLLIFDKIYFLDPLENRCLIPDKVAKIRHTQSIHSVAGAYGVLYNGINHEAEENLLLDKFDYGIHKGIINVLNLGARKFYEKHWLPLRLSYDFDTGNAELLNNFLPLMVKNQNNRSIDGMLRGGMVNFNNIKIYPDIPPDISFFDEQENRIYHMDHQLMSVAGKFNRFLSVSNEYNLIPIFINENLARAYSYKVDVARNNNETRLNEKFLSYHGTSLDRVQFLLQRISEVILPDEVIEQISVKELIYARNNTFQECLKLRRKLIKTISFLRNNSFDDEFIDEVNKYIQLEVEPALNAYQSKFLESLSKFMKYSITFGGAVAGSIIGVQQSLSPEAIAYLSGISAMVGNISSDLAEYVIKKPTQKINTFSYFVNLRD